MAKCTTSMQPNVKPPSMVICWECTGECCWLNYAHVICCCSYMLHRETPMSLAGDVLLSSRRRQQSHNECENSAEHVNRHRGCRHNARWGEWTAIWEQREQHRHEFVPEGEVHVGGMSADMNEKNGNGMRRRILIWVRGSERQDRRRWQWGRGL